MSKSLGRTAYEAYCKVHGLEGDWEDAAERRAWDSAATAVLRESLARSEDHAALLEVTTELHTARQAHEPMHSAHEGLGVLLEEVDELQREVFLKESKRNLRQHAQRSVPGCRGGGAHHDGLRR